MFAQRCVTICIDPLNQAVVYGFDDAERDFTSLASTLDGHPHQESSLSFNYLCNPDAASLSLNNAYNTLDNSNDLFAIAVLDIALNEHCLFHLKEIA